MICQEERHKKQTNQKAIFCHWNNNPLADTQRYSDLLVILRCSHFYLITNLSISYDYVAILSVQIIPSSPQWPLLETVKIFSLPAKAKSFISKSTLISASSNLPFVSLECQDFDHPPNDRRTLPQVDFGRRKNKNI
jgi:hypothetical protein